jgi:hypothetical protein
MESDALREPFAVGLNVMLMVQLAPVAKVDPQVLVCAKSPAFVPAIEMLLIVILALPAFVRVTIRAALFVFTR